MMKAKINIAQNYFLKALKMLLVNVIPSFLLLLFLTLF